MSRRRRTSNRALWASAVAAVALSLGCAAPVTVPAAAPPPAPPPKSSPADTPLGADAVVARWRGGQLVYRDLLEHAGDEIDALRVAHQRQLYALKRAALRELIAQRLIEQGARAAGTTVDAYLAQLDELTRVDEAEVRAFFDQHLAGEGKPFDELAPDIRQHLSEQRRESARSALVARLEETAGVTLELEPPAEARVELDLEGRPSLGPADAPLTVVIFADFECPYCGEAARAAHRWVAEHESEVRVVFLHHPLDIHPAARSAALAAECAHRQGKFWALHDRLFAHQDGLRSGLSAMREHAAAVGLDVPAFDRCMADPDTADRIDDDLDQADEAGVQGTPAVFVNGIALDGIPSWAELASFRRGGAGAPPAGALTVSQREAQR